MSGPAHRVLRLDRWIRFDKRSFVGREALLRVQAQGLSERWVGLVLDSPVPAAYPAPIFSVGHVATVKERISSGSEAGAYRDTRRAGWLYHLQQPGPHRRPDVGAGLCQNPILLAGLQFTGRYQWPANIGHGHPHTLLRSAGSAAAGQSPG